MTQLTQIQLFQLQQQQQQQATVQAPQSTPTLPGVVEEPVIEGAATSTEQVITDLDAALAVSPTVAVNDPFQPLNTSSDS